MVITKIELSSKGQNAKIILSRIVIVEYSIETKNMCLMINIIGDEHIDKLMIYKKVNI